MERLSFFASIRQFECHNRLHSEGKKSAITTRGEQLSASTPSRFEENHESLTFGSKILRDPLLQFRKNQSHTIVTRLGWISFLSASLPKKREREEKKPVVT